MRTTERRPCGRSASIAFFVSGKNMQAATWALVAASAVSLAVGYAVERRLAPVPLVAGGAALVFGGLALVFHDPRLLKIKPTVMNTLFAVLLLGGLALKKNPLRLILSDAFDLPEATWRRLTINYALFFLSLAATVAFCVLSQLAAVPILWYVGQQIGNLAPGDDRYSPPAPP